VIPAIPSGITATPAGGGIEVTWTDASAFEDGYEVERASATEAFHVVARLAAGTTSYHDAVASDASYVYRVRATRDGGGSGYSAHARLPTAPTTPTAPSGLQVMPARSPGIGVSWTDASSNEDGFRVERSTDGGGNWSTVGTISYAPSSFWDFIDWGARLEAPTCYRVLAYNALGDSPPTATACTTAVAAPTELTATPTAEGTVLLTWRDNSAVEDGYCVYAERAGDCFAGDMWPGCVELPPNTTSYVDVGYGPCGEPTYDYQVAAMKDGGWSDFAQVPWTPYP
jgi:titin